MPPVNPQLPDPTRDPVLASFDNYLLAQEAVDKLSDNKFPVQKVAIVGVDLRMVEQVIGRMSWGRAAGGGLLTGAWFGLLLGLFVSFFASAEDSNPTTLILLGLIYGAGFGIIFGLVSYWGEARLPVAKPDRRYQVRRTRHRRWTRRRSQDPWFSRTVATAAT